MSQQQMQVAMSLLQDVEDEAKTIPEGSPSSKDRALALINGDLRLASKQAASLSERDSAFIRSMCLISEARLRCRFVAEPEGKQRKKELTTAAQMIEQAIAIHDTTDKYSLLGAIHTDLGNWDQARAAYTKASTSDDAAIATEARKSLLRLNDFERTGKDPLLRFLNYVEKHTLSTTYFFCAVVLIIINNFYPFVLLPLFAFGSTCSGIFSFFKESFGKK